MGQHLSPGGQDFAHHRSRGVAAGQFHGGLNHRQGKALHPVAVKPKVTLFGLRQARLQRGAICMLGQQGHEPVVGQPEDGFIVPKGVVGIEADRSDAHPAP